MSVCKVSAYRTTDGSLFETEKQAKEYEFSGWNRRILREDLGRVVPRSEPMLVETLTTLLIAEGFIKIDNLSINKQKQKLYDIIRPASTYFSMELSLDVAEFLARCGWVCKHATLADYMED